MKATETNFLKFLQGPKQFLIPIYQRTYSWTLRECRQLWNDICKAASDDTLSAHFVGSIVYVENGLYQVTALPQLLVIDGQQRLTTLMLLLAALAKAIDASSDTKEITGKKIRSYALFNSDEDGELRFKLVLTQGDKDTMARLLEGRELPASASPRLIENFRFFEEQIRLAPINLDSLYHGISKLLIIDVALDRERDNPQLIFESLNSTGLDLTQADLIRNYVLMGLEPKRQERIYQDAWYPMEQSFGASGYAAQFDRFMRDYLTIKNRQIPNINEVYVNFKAYAGRLRQVPVEDLVADVYRFSKHFVKLAFDGEQDLELRRAIRDINTLKVDVAYPFLMEVYDDYTAGRLGRDDFLAILRLVETYVFRRAICGIATNSMNKTFATLGREIDRSAYLESVQEAMMSKEGNVRMPGDEEFRRELVVKDVYNFRSRNYLLGKLENHGRKEPVDVESYTIEHVLPQNANLSQEWRDALGPEWKAIQERWLHTLGNLTLTGYNSELGDRPFLRKRDMEGGFKDSPIRLNQDLARLDHWNEQTIRERAEALAEKAIAIWPVPKVQVVRQSADTNAEALLAEVFHTDEELAAARALFQEAIADLDPASIPRLTSISFREGRKLTLVIGAWVALRFRRTKDGIEALFLVDAEDCDAWDALKVRTHAPMEGQWAGGRPIKLVAFPWQPDLPLPESFRNAWHAALARAAEVFGDWSASQSKKWHLPSLAEQLLDLQASEPTYEHLVGPVLDVYEELRKRILNLDAEVREDKKKLYIAFKADTNFVDVVPQKRRLRLSLNMPFDAIHDPKGLCKDVSNIGRWGNGDVEVGVATMEDVDAVMPLIRQAFDWQTGRDPGTERDDAVGIVPVDPTQSPVEA